MESVVRSSQLVLFAAFVVKATSRIPCAAHQNVDGWCPGTFRPLPVTTPQPFLFPYPIPLSFPSALLHHHVPVEQLLPPYIPEQGVGGGTNQPNVITQSVTWSSAKKGQKPTSSIEGDCPMDEILLESSSSPKAMKLMSGSGRYGRSEYADAEDDLDFKLKRLVRLLDNMQKREEKCEWGTCSRPRKTWKKNYWRRRERFEDDDYPDSEYSSAEEEEEVQQVRKPKRARYQKMFDEDVEEEPKRVKMMPKMDWLVLKKCPKRYPKRWFRDDVDRERDSAETAPPRDILYIPPSEPREKYRRRVVNDYAR